MRYRVQYHVIRATIREKIPDWRCPLCGFDGPWGGGDAIVEIPVLAYEARDQVPTEHNGQPPSKVKEEDGHTLITSVPIFCTACGFLAHLQFGTLFEEEDDG